MVDLITEVNEELRRERFNRYWQKIGGYIVAASILIVVATVGSVLWQNYSESRQEQAAEAFFAADRDSRAQRNMDAAQKYAEVAERNAKGFTALARMREAFVLAKAGEEDKALQAYQSVMDERGADAGVKALARIHSAALMQQQGASQAEISAVLEPLAENRDNAFSAFAREQLAYVALHHGDAQKAHRMLTELSSDMGAPASLRRRTQAQLSLVSEKAGQQP